MPFPLPLDPEYRKEIVRIWLEDVNDRIKGGSADAEVSWKIAQGVYLSLPPGEGDEDIELALFRARVKLDQTE